MAFCRFCAQDKSDVVRYLLGGHAVCDDCDRESPWLEELKTFMGMVDRELRENTENGKEWASNRRSWRNGTSSKAVLYDMYYHVGKLQAAMMSGDKEAMQEHSADVAATAFIFLDTVGGIDG